MKGLTPASEYEFRVSAENKVGSGKPSDASRAVVTKEACGKLMTSFCIPNLKMHGSKLIQMRFILYTFFLKCFPKPYS